VIAHLIEENRERSQQGIGNEIVSGAPPQRDGNVEAKERDSAGYSSTIIDGRRSPVEFSDTTGTPQKTLDTIPD